MEAKENSIVLSNKLIAEFMDTNHRVSSWEGREDVILIYPLDSNGDKLLPIVADYKGSWDWLMPVVEKIEAYTCLEIAKTYVQINDKSCAIWTYFDVKEILRLTGDDKNEEGKFKVRYNSKSKIESTWLAVIDFIKWRNSTNPRSSNKK